MTAVENAVARAALNIWPSAGGVSRDEQVAARRAYDAAEGENIKQFAAELAHENGIANPAIAALVFEKAWEDGHSSGYGEVGSYYEDIAGFVERIVDLTR